MRSHPVYNRRVYYGDSFCSLELESPLGDGGLGEVSRGRVYSAV